MKKFLLFGLLLAGFGLAGCEFNQLAGDEQVDELMLVPKQQTQQKAKTNSNQQTVLLFDKHLSGGRGRL